MTYEAKTLLEQLQSQSTSLSKPDFLKKKSCCHSCSDIPCVSLTGLIRTNKSFIFHPTPLALIILLNSFEQYQLKTRIADINSKDSNHTKSERLGEVACLIDRSEAVDTITDTMCKSNSRRSVGSAGVPLARPL